MKGLLRLLLGLAALIVGVYFLAEFFIEFAKLIIGLLLFMIGIHLITAGGNRPKIFVR